MSRLDTVVRTKITPPRMGPRTLDGARASRLCFEALVHRLTLVRAVAGFC